MESIALAALKEFPQLFWVAIPGALIVGALWYWQKFVRDRLHLARERTQRLLDLVEDPTLRIQMAASDAFGVVLDNRVIDEAKRRENPLGLINDFIKARRYLRTFENGAFALLPAESKSKTSEQAKKGHFKRKGKWMGLSLFTVATFPFIAMLMLPFFGPATDLKTFQLLILVCQIASLPFILPMISALTAIYAADRLFNELDLHYPLRSGCPVQENRAMLAPPSLFGNGLASCVDSMADETTRLS